MDKTCKYYQYQRYVSYDNGQTWHPMGEYQRGELMEFNSPDCGAGIDAIYKWVLLDANTDYYCDDCPSEIPPPTMYRWHLGEPYDYICSGTTKCYKQYKQYSSDGGIVWQNVYPIETKMTNVVIESLSSECGVGYAWRPRPINEEYVCSGDSMYYKEYYQVTYDYGETWEDVIPTSSRTGNMYSECATQCGCGLPMFEANYSDSSSYKVVCGVSGDVITASITKSYKPISAMTDCLIGNCATAIDDYALSNGKNLSACTIGSGVTSIGESAFYGSGIRNITIPNGVTSIGNSIFNNCTSLSSCTIGNGVTNISENAFYNCYNLSNCAIGSGITSIDDSAFEYCTSLAGIDIPDSVTSIGINAFSNCSGMSSCTIGSNVTNIGNSAFSRCYNITSIDIPDSVTSVGERAFYYCSGMTSCSIGSGVTSIGRYTFFHCRSLTSIDIPDNVTSIGYQAFLGCYNLSDCTIGNGVTSIGNYAFQYCSGMTSCTIGSGVTSIGDSAFKHCASIASIDIPNGVTTISSNAFQYCTSLTSMTVNAITPPALGNDYVFDNAPITSINVPAESVESYKTASRWSRYADIIIGI